MEAFYEAYMAWLAADDAWAWFAHFNQGYLSGVLVGWFLWARPMRKMKRNLRKLATKLEETAEHLKRSH